MTTRFILLLFVCILNLTDSSAQNFEGKIVYSNKYKSKTTTMPDEQFTSMMGTTQEFSIKGGDYKSSLNGKLVQWQIYINQDNKLYTKMSNVSSILWKDAAINDNEVLTSEINKNAIEILGYMCDELILTCKSGVQKFYFNSTLKVDPALYANHKFLNWNEVISKSNALPLKIILETPQFGLESIAVEIKPMVLDKTLFELPADSKLEKSPY
ncbi:MAG: hypothetical protein ABI663_08465 [Chryseolinea sp.]